MSGLRKSEGELRDMGTECITIWEKGKIRDSVQTFSVSGLV